MSRFVLCYCFVFSGNDATPDSAFTDWAVCVFQDNLDGAVFMREGVSNFTFHFLHLLSLMFDKF